MWYVGETRCFAANPQSLPAQTKANLGSDVLWNTAGRWELVGAPAVQTIGLSPLEALAPGFVFAAAILKGIVYPWAGTSAYRCQVSVAQVLWEWPSSGDGSW